MISPRAHLPTRRLINLLTRAETPVRANRERIDRLTGYLLEHAGEMGTNTLVLVSVQDAAFVNAGLLTLLRSLSPKVAYLGLLGARLDPGLVSGVRSTPLAA